MTRRAALFLLPLVLAAAGAAAERGDREKEIVVGADRLTADDANRTSTFEGAVVITQGTMRMTAGKVVVREDAQRNKVYVASGSPPSSSQPPQPPPPQPRRGPSAATARRRSSSAPTAFSPTTPTAPAPSRATSSSRRARCA